MPFFAVTTRDTGNIAGLLLASDREELTAMMIEAGCNGDHEIFEVEGGGVIFARPGIGSSLPRLDPEAWRWLSEADVVRLVEPQDCGVRVIGDLRDILARTCVPAGAAQDQEVLG